MSKTWSQATIDDPGRYSNVLNVRNYGVIGDGVTNNASAIDAALAAVGAEGGVVWFPAGGEYATVGGHVIPDGVTIAADGAVIKHTGNNICFDFNSTGEFRSHPRSGTRGLQLIGSPGAAAIGVEIGNMWGFFAENSCIG